MENSSSLHTRFIQLRALFRLMDKQKYKYVVLVTINQMTGLIGNLGIGIIFSVLINGLLENRVAVFWQCVLAILFLFIFIFLLFPYLSYKTSMIAKNILYQLRKDLYMKTVDIKFEAVSERSRQNLYASATNDVEAVSSFFAGTFQELIFCLIYFIGTFLVMVYLNIWIAMIVLLSALTIFFVNGRYTTKIDKANQEIKQNNEEIIESYHQIQSAIRTILIYLLESKVISRFLQTADLLVAARRRQAKLQNQQGFITGILTDICGWGSYLLGAVFVGVGMMNLGNVVLFAQAQNGVTNLFDAIPNLLSGISNAHVSYERIQQILSLPEENGETVGKHLSSIPGRPAVQVENLSFSYVKNVPVLNGAGLVIQPCSVNAIIARNGSGKSTFIRLLTRLLEPDEGHIRVLGTEITGCDAADLRTAIHYVEQNQFIFSISIRDNICLGQEGHDIPDDEVQTAADLACIHDRIAEMPGQYETVMNRSEINFSKGEQQRVALARMFLSRADVLIMDEAMSAIDAGTATRIVGNIQKMRDKTVIYICHDIQTMPEVDHVYYLRNGQFAELTNEDVLKTVNATRTDTEVRAEKVHDQRK